MENDTTNKKADKNLSEKELANVTGGTSSCYEYYSQEVCESDPACHWNSKAIECVYNSAPA